MLKQFSALKGQRNVAQGKRLSAPPWVKVPSEFTPLPRLEVPGYGKMGSQSGGEGKGSGGSLGTARRMDPGIPRVRRPNLWDTISSVEEGKLWPKAMAGMVRPARVPTTPRWLPPREGFSSLHRLLIQGGIFSYLCRRV
jgi:hypothetical protein